MEYAINNSIVLKYSSHMNILCEQEISKSHEWLKVCTECFPRQAIALYNYHNSTTADQVTSLSALVQGHQPLKMGTAASFGIPICWLLSIEPFALT
jgi:hypothetical protein